MTCYSKQLAEEIVTLIEQDTYTIAEICNTMGISDSSFYKWKAKKGEFAEIVDNATKRRDQKLVLEARNSLRRKLQGYTITETKTTFVPPKEGEDDLELRIKEQVVNEKYHAPDTSAIVFTLTNKDAENWRGKQSAEIVGIDNTPIVVNVTTLKAKKELELLQKRLGK